MNRIVLFLLGCALVTLSEKSAWPQAFPINSDVALQPAEGQLIYRTQFRWRHSEIDGTKANIDTYISSHVFVYGWNSRFSTVLGVPLIFRDFDGSGTERHEYGVGDIKALLRYQLWKNLGFLESQSWTILGGIEAPSYDRSFSSRSWDPILGTIYSWRKNRQGIDFDLIYQFNTENDRDFEQGDFFRYDLAYQYRLWPAQYASDTRWNLTGLLELNGEYRFENELDGQTLNETGGHQVFLSPGLVLAGERVKYEAGLQFPVYQNVGDFAQEDSVRAVAGFTISF